MWLPTSGEVSRGKARTVKSMDGARLGKARVISKMHPSDPRVLGQSWEQEIEAERLQSVEVAHSRVLGMEEGLDNYWLSLGTKYFTWSHLITSGASDGKESACNVGDSGLIPGSGRWCGGGHDNLFQYCGMENSMDREAWHTTVYGITESDRPEWLIFHFIFIFDLNLTLCNIMMNRKCTKN